MTVNPLLSHRLASIIFVIFVLLVVIPTCVVLYNKLDTADDTVIYQCTGSTTSVELTPEGQPEEGSRFNYDFEKEFSINVSKKFVLIPSQKISVDADITGSAIEWDIQESTPDDETLRLHFRIDRNTGHFQAKGRGESHLKLGAPKPYELSQVGRCAIK